MSYYGAFMEEKVLSRTFSLEAHEWLALTLNPRPPYLDVNVSWLSMSYYGDFMEEKVLSRTFSLEAHEWLALLLNPCPPYLDVNDCWLSMSYYGAFMQGEDKDIHSSAMFRFNSYTRALVCSSLENELTSHVLTTTLHWIQDLKSPKLILVSLGGCVTKIKHG
ncbi:alpha/beta-hydrolases-like protein [Corchorus olitorius]|uniref:Alpha/beta-hydrolases-like protein n=1 Tax=Corchorus olitorius TaxID=93759 RepID=A0A1R3HF06_9ROSI|nr:alpha/beta-hydrolases-like protein [Corchorus olitorius]